MVPPSPKESIASRPLFNSPSKPFSRRLPKFPTYLCPSPQGSPSNGSEPTDDGQLCPHAAHAQSSRFRDDSCGSEAPGTGLARHLPHYPFAPAPAPSTRAAQPTRLCPSMAHLCRRALRGDCRHRHCALRRPEQVTAPLGVAHAVENTKSAQSLGVDID